MSDALQGVRLRKAIQNCVRILERRDIPAGQKTVRATRRPPFRPISKADLEAARRDPAAGRPPAGAPDVTLTR
jgi:hypothetical protein